VTTPSNKVVPHSEWIAARRGCSPSRRNSRDSATNSRGGGSIEIAQAMDM
jgi:hypothetical protein